jgi:hypothetical protein
MLLMELVSMTTSKNEISAVLAEKDKRKLPYVYSLQMVPPALADIT